MTRSLYSIVVLMAVSLLITDNISTCSALGTSDHHRIRNNALHRHQPTCTDEFTDNNQKINRKGKIVHSTHRHIRPVSQTLLASTNTGASHHNRSRFNGSGDSCINNNGALDLNCVEKGLSQQTNLAGTTTTQPPRLTKKAAFLSIFLPWLYFVGGALNVPTLPRYVNYAISPDGDSKVSKLGAQVFGNINGLDSFFTFLSVNLIGVLSDIYGRKGFMVFSTIGLGVSHLLMSYAHVPRTFYIAACIDGISSCMLSQSQAYISDLQQGAKNKNIGIALSRFQGVAIGLAYMIGIPLGGVISKAYSYRTPLQVSFVVCIINAILIGLFLPLPPTPPVVEEDVPNAVPLTDSGTVYSNVSTHTLPNGGATSCTPRTAAHTTAKINWKQANPFGAIHMFVYNKKLLLLGIIYFLMNFSHSTLQVNWINYLQYKYQWSAQLSGSTLMIVGLFVAILPSYFVPLLGKLNAIKYSLLMHSVIVAYLGKVLVLLYTSTCWLCLIFLRLFRLE